MTTFGDYARYYNLLYKDKDYASEVAFILHVLRQNGCSPKSLLDLGCGTGCHALAMAKKGIAVEGVDLSETMLHMGAKMIQAAREGGEEKKLPVLHYGDARTVRLGRKFDAVTSLFHVMSYQNTDEDALAVLQTAKEHLVSGGLFLFDFWHGPGVLATPPRVREKVMQDADTYIRRVATPIMHAEAHIIDVQYAITLSSVSAEEVELKECHSMRYWWVEEVELLAQSVRFTPIASGGWMHRRKASSTDWNAWILLRSE